MRAVVAISVCALALFAEHRISAQDMKGRQTHQLSKEVFPRTISQSQQHLRTYAPVAFF